MKSSHKKVAEILGWYGAVAIVSAYALVSLEIIESKGWLYQILNLTGALGIMVIAIAKKDRQPAVLNIFWAAIALIALIRLALS
jgi:hypothetical protein